MNCPRSQHIRIYIATQGGDKFPDDNGYLPMHVGADLIENDTILLKDNTGASISALNASFCELTALYWMWKNERSYVVGLNHYRRFFSPRNKAIPYKGISIAASDDFTELNNGADIIVSTPARLTLGDTGIPISVLSHYSSGHELSDMYLARMYVKERMPDYVDAFDFVMNSNIISQYNMFVAKKDAIDSYCSWIFDILFALERMLPYEFYSGYQARVFGFIAERLFNVWLLRNRARYRVVYRNVVPTVAGIW